MPGINRQSVDILCETIAKDMAIGITSHMLFAVVDSHDKDPTGSKASLPDMPLQQAVAKLKAEYGEGIVIMTDVCFVLQQTTGIAE